jgi:hypothetical protein
VFLQHEIHRQQACHKKQEIKIIPEEQATLQQQVIIKPQHT